MHRFFLNLLGINYPYYLIIILKINILYSDQNYNILNELDEKNNSVNKNDNNSNINNNNNNNDRFNDDDDDDDDDLPEALDKRRPSHPCRPPRQPSRQSSS